MEIFSKNLLIGSQFTLTVITDPISATCTLTYEGQSYNAKTATVKVGTVISYSVYHPTYGTTTGNITMNSDKTLTCNGTYSTSTTDVAWSRPNLNSNGSVGGSSFACYADTEYGAAYAYKAFDGSASTYWCSTATGVPQTVTYYTPTPVRVTSLSITTRTGGNYYVTSATIQGSNDNSSWSNIGTYSNSTNDSGVTHSASITNSSSYFKYIRIYISGRGGSGSYVTIGDCYFSGYYQTTSYTYYWNKSVT